MISFFILTIAFIYSLLICYLVYGWFRLKSGTSGEPEFYTKVSVIIPARNEYENIGLLLKDISRQTYPADMAEVIVVDDSSDDETAKLAQRVMQENQIHGEVISLQEVSPNPSPKKRALTEGINRAAGELVITTDADCRAGKDWLKTMVSHYQKSGSVLLSGPVRHAPLTTSFSKIQALEFNSLIASGAGAIGAGRALMSNGANLAFRRKAFLAVRGYEGNESFVSGDDVFLMMKLQQAFGRDAITFVRNYKAIINTAAKNTWREFMEQRTRWASKTRAYKTFFALFTSVMVFFFNFLLLLSPLYLLMDITAYAWVLTAWAAKFFIDALLLFPVSRFLGQAHLLWYYIPAQFFVVFYISLAGFLGVTKKFRWKGREYKK